MTDIDSGSVSNGLTHLSRVTNNIREAKRHINEASSLLDSRISNPYGYLKELIRKIELRENDIVDLCNDFINDTEQTKEEIAGVSFEPSGDLAESTLLAATATAGTTFAGEGADVGSERTDLSSQETNGVTDNPEEGLNTQFVEEGERSTDGVSPDDQEAFEDFGDGDESDESGDSTVRGDGEIGTDDAGSKKENMLSEEDYQALDALEEPTDSSYIDVDVDDAEYIAGLVNECDYIPKEDKDYIITQLKRGNIRSAICRILVVQKKQEIAELKKTKVYADAIYADEAAAACKEAARLSINSKDQMDLWQLQREREREAANLRNTPEYKEVEASLAVKEAELHQYENSCKLWEYDYILPLVKNSDVDAAKARFDTKAQEAEDSAMMLSKYPASQASAVLLFENAKKYRDLNTILNDNEILTYWYLYDNEGEDAANEYLGLLEPKVNSYYGMEMAEESFRNILNSDKNGWFLGDLSADWEGIQIGTIEWFEVVGNIFSKTGTMTRSEYAVAYINNMLGSMSYFIPLSKADIDGLKTQNQISSQTYDALTEKINAGEQITYLDIMYMNGSITEEEYNSFRTLGEDPDVQAFIERNNTDNKFLGMNHLEWLAQFFNSGVTTGNMLPSVFASLMTYGAAGGFGIGAAAANTLSKAAGLATMFVYCLSADKNAALREGRSEYSAWIHGILSASGEIGTEIIFDKLFGFIPGLPDFGMMPSSNKWKAVGKIALRLFVLAPLGEITEEMVQYALFDPMSDLIAYGSTDFNFKFEEALNIALTTFISTFQLQLGSTVISAPATVKRSGTTCEIDIGNGTKIQISYAELAKCYNQQTGQIDAQKLNKLLISKTGTTFIINGTEVGLTFEEINSCRDTTGHIVRSKIDSILQSKLDAIQQQEVNGAQDVDIDIQIEGEIESVFENNPNYLDITDKYAEDNNFTVPNGCIVIFDTKTETYYLLNKHGQIIRNLTKYEKIINHDHIFDVTETLKDTVKVEENQYIVYDKISKNFVLLDSEGKIVQELDLNIDESTLGINVENHNMGLIVELETMEDNALAKKYIEQLSTMYTELTDEQYDKIIKACEEYKKLDTMFKEKYGMSIEDFLKGDNIITDKMRAENEEGAQYLYEYVAAAEPEVTQLLQSLEINGIKLVGLDHKFKSIDGIIRKFAQGQQVTDALRYTYVVNESTYSADVMTILYVLKSNGYDISYINNHWDKAGYKGLNVGLTTADGVPVEIQFHTNSSYTTKEEFNHVLYELARNRNIPVEIRKIAGDIMVMNQEVLNGFIPEGATDLNDYNVSNALGTRKYSSYEEFQADYAAEGKAWFDALPEEVKEYFRSYKSEDTYAIGNYHIINRILRGLFFSNDGQTVSPSYDGVWVKIDKFESFAHMTLEEFVAKTKTAIQEMILAGQGIKVKQNTIIYRGFNYDALAKYGIQKGDSPEVIYEKLTKDGFIYTDEGFMSSSAFPSSITTYKDIVLEINTQKGTAIIDLSAINPAEREVLFLPGQKFHIDGVYTQDTYIKGQIVIKLTSIPDTNSTVDGAMDAIDTPKVDVNQNQNATDEEEDWFDPSDLFDNPADVLDQFNVGGNEGVHIFDEWNDFFADYEADGFTKLLVKGEETMLYDGAPEFSSMNELMDYATKTVGEPDGIPKTAMAFLKFIHNQSSGSTFDGALYYSFMNLVSSCNLPVDQKVKVFNLLINSSEELRTSISLSAKSELTDVLASRFGITDPLVVGALYEALLGQYFVQNGLAQTYDWTDFGEMMDGLIDKVLQKSIDSGKEPVLWSGFDNEDHDTMDEHFTTIANTTINGLYFIETIFTNWDFDNQTYKVSDLWAKLSEVYAKNLSTAINPETGMPYETVKFLYPAGVKVTESFGTLFKEVELPQLVKDGKIKTITLAETDPKTMEVIRTVDIDISYLGTYYSIMSKNGNDPGLNDTIFDMFLDDVKEATK